MLRLIATLAILMSRPLFALDPVVSDADYITTSSVNPAGEDGVPVDRNGLQAAIQAVPESLRKGIFKISADGGKPNPRVWYFLAKGTGNNRGTFSITVSDGEIVEQSHSRDPRALFFRGTPIDIDKIHIDTEVAWSAGLQYVERKGKKLGSISYVISQSGKQSTPVWSLWCYTPRNGYLGRLKILTTTGDVIESK